MMEWLADYGLFLLKAITIAAVILLVVGFVAGMNQRNRAGGRDGQIRIQDLNEELKDQADDFQESLLSDDDLKQHRKAQKKKAKLEAKEEKKKRKQQDAKEQPEESGAGRLFVLDFDGDIKASGVEALRQEITAIVGNKHESDEVLIRLQSPGGLVHSYGLAASQLARIKQAGLRLVVVVDEVAASGGYMMACVADEIIAAPFSVIGSIGVVAQIPNVHRLLKKNDIDVEILTAGEYKRTLTVLGENTEKGRQKFIEELESTHELFKLFISEHRPELDLEAVATGEVWYGRDALANGLVDRIQTSDDYILESTKSKKVYKISYEHKKTFAEKLGLAAELGLTRALTRIWSQHLNRWF